MLQKIINNKFRILQLLALVFLLVLVRAFENELFYDPLLNFFKKDFTNLDLPQFDFALLMVNVLFRYALNTVFSLGVIYILFKDISMIKFALFLYAFFFVIFAIGFFYIVYFSAENHNWILFYIRRFLIQPIFLLVFIAGFYYQKQR
ncbi:exosortase F system-associated membrane protein [Flavobacterium weaverense]|uniref:Exosortase F-associated protein n=1 Tax=Flavobacterium weaverense TaxID=271156 RepID=A0A3L9ZZW3_9FLAO|nr:exosortase F system-associated protein [Flavobacterium weaverense]RMA77976.1 exosortase F-associated protein [Flavobacterium weaverense]